MNQKRRILLAPDSFKGCFSSIEVTALIEKAFKSVSDNFEFVSYPVADGGEGSLDAFSYFLKCQKKEVEVCGPDLKPIKIWYLIHEDKAFIETSMICGFASGTTLRDPKVATSYGVGEAILDAIKEGAKEIYVCVGGTLTNDGGAGALSALGTRFYKNGSEFVPVGGTLADITSLDTNELDPLLSDVTVKILSDVQNPLLGFKGATFTFARQKGADEKELEKLEKGMQNLAEISENYVNKLKKDIPGSGCGGGLGWGLSLFLDSKILSGSKVICDLFNLKEEIAKADFVITGEGKLDSQSLDGKLIGELSYLALEANKPLFVIVGKNELDDEQIKKLGITQVFDFGRNYLTEDDISLNSRNDLYQACVDLAKRLISNSRVDRAK